MDTQIYKSLNEFIDDVQDGINVWFVQRRYSINYLFVLNLLNWLNDFIKGITTNYKQIKISNGENITLPILEIDEKRYIDVANLILSYSNQKMSKYDKALKLYQWYVRQFEENEEEIENTIKHVESLPFVNDKEKLTIRMTEKYIKDREFFKKQMKYYQDYIQNIRHTEPSLVETIEPPYVESLNVESLNDEPSQIGGRNNYHQKYLKYKNKYLRLKRRH